MWKQFFLRSFVYGRVVGFMLMVIKDIGMADEDQGWGSKLGIVTRACRVEVTLS